MAAVWGWQVAISPSLPDSMLLSCVRAWRGVGGSIRPCRGPDILFLSYSVYSPSPLSRRLVKEKIRGWNCPIRLKPTIFALKWMEGRLSLPLSPPEGQGHRLSSPTTRELFWQFLPFSCLPSWFLSACHLSRLSDQLFSHIRRHGDHRSWAPHPKEGIKMMVYTITGERGWSGWSVLSPNCLGGGKSYRFTWGLG